MLNKYLSKKIVYKFLNYFLFILIGLTFLFGRSFMGLYLFGFRFGELLVGFSLLFWFVVLGIFVSNKYNFSLSRSTTLTIFLVPLSFLTVALVRQNSFISTYTYKSSSYVWTLSIFFLGVLIYDNFEFDKFDLIIDNQTRFINSLIYKKIPHRYYITPCLNYFMSKPFTFLKKRNQFAVKVVDYINKIQGYNQEPIYKIDIPEKFLNEAKRLIPNNKYIGFSITTANPYRIKSFNINEIIKVANFYSERFTPTFFIEKKYQELITQLKENVKNCYIPEEKSSNEFQRPMLVTALGSLTKFNLSINNGISHMLSFSQNKNFLFFNEQSEKWKPENKNTCIYDCKDKNTTIDKLSSDKIIEFLENN